MAEPTCQPSAAQRPENVADPIDDAAALERALEIVPRGAVALVGTALGLVMLTWLFVHFAVFLPRGAVG
jgi:uncharacterized oligopeptide transporter (OPT) family protein